MSEYNNYRHAMRVLRDMERQLGGGTEKSPSASRNTRDRAPMDGGPRAGQWKLQDSFTPEGLAAAAGEGARFFSEDVFRPAGNVVNRGLGALADGVEQWNQNRMARDRAERDLAARYMPQIRASDARLGSLMEQDRDLTRREGQRVQDFDRGNQYIQNRLDSQRFDGMPAFSPQDMSDDELMAELAALEGGRQ